MNKINSQTLIEAMTDTRSHLVESVIWDDYPNPESVEALAVLTHALRNIDEDLPSDIGRRVVMNNGDEGVITGQYNDHLPVTYNVFIDGEGEVFEIEPTLTDPEWRPITEDDFEFVEDSDG
jgi:hypothetical protein